MSEKKRADGTWYTSFRYTTWDGKRKQKKKEGFKTLGAAKKYREEFLKKVTGNCDIKFSAMVELYLADCKHRLRPTSIVTKESVLNTHILPYLGDMAINEITPAVIRSWHNQLLDKKFSDTYYRTINTQASAVFNYAVKYYNLSFNPVTRCDPIGKKKVPICSSGRLTNLSNSTPFLRDRKLKWSLSCCFGRESARANCWRLP